MLACQGWVLVGSRGLYLAELEAGYLCLQQHREPACVCVPQGARTSYVT